MKISARNQLSANVIAIHPGAVNTEVVLQLAGGQEVVSIVTNSAVQSLGLKVGMKAYAVIKASSVLIGVD